MSAGARHARDTHPRRRSAGRSLQQASLSSLVGLIALLGPGVAASAPPCAQQCERLAEAGDLQGGMTAEACAHRVCQDSASRLYARNRFDEAMQALDYIHASRKGAPSYELERGKVLYALGRYEAALASFDVVVEHFPNSVRGGAQRGHTLARLGRLDDARAQFEALLDDSGAEREFNNLLTRSYLLQNIGQLKLRQGDLAGGKADVRKALELDSRNLPARTLLERVIPYLETGALDSEGIDLLEHAFEQLQLQKLDASERDFRELMRRWPRYAPAYLILAEGLTEQSNYAGCEELLLQAQKGLPDDLEIRLARIRCTILRYGVASKGARAAIRELHSLAEQHPDNRTITRMLAAVE